MTRKTTKRYSRRGFFMPMLGVFLIALFAFVALAVDIGMITVARTQCQNAADVAALAGTRNLNNKPGSVDNNKTNALAAASSAITNNKLLNESFTSAQVTSTTTGVYSYNTTSQTFSASYPGSAPSGQSWTAMRVVVNVDQPTFFARVLGFNTMPTGAIATAVYRPRDVAFVLDMTGSMGYASTFSRDTADGTPGSLNPDDLVPSFGHYSALSTQLRATSNYTNGSGEAFSRNNITITTPGGPPIVRNFYFDPVNLSTPSDVASPVSIGTYPNYDDPTKTEERAEGYAFHRIEKSKITEGDSTNYGPPTYDFTGYSAFNNTATLGPCPAPDFYGSQIDSGGITYAGDRWRRKDGKIYKTSTSWTSSTTRMAGTAAELLGYGISTSSGITYVQYQYNNAPGTVSYSSSTARNRNSFRDPVWEAHGYDLDIAAYRTWRASNSNRPGSSGTAFSTLLPEADRFQGYSMGPGYWGKTFYIWPPDPRKEKDWRKRFFTNWNNSNNTTTNINNSLLNNSGGSHTLKSGSFTPNYSEILSWIKTGPQTLPPNLRAGRVCYYSSIPNDVNTGTGSTEQRLDKVFWREYIDFVLTNGYTNDVFLYGSGDSWSSASTSIMSGNMAAWQGPSNSFSVSDEPYMAYTDSPSRPRLHMWFGPLTMIDFIGTAGGRTTPTMYNWRPGTSYEAQCWQLKASMNSVIDDIRNNHPNDSVGLTMFAQTNFQHVRVPIGQDYTTLKNALFYPKSLLEEIKDGDTTTEIRPYDQSFNNQNNGEIPNAGGYTDPNSGLACAFNLLCPSASLGTEYGTQKGRRGASKLVIFETDGVPNSYRDCTFSKKGYDSYYTIGDDSGFTSNGNSTSISRATGVVSQMMKTMSTNNSTNTDSGLSLPNAPCRVYSIAFGDLFDSVLAPSASYRDDALEFLADIQVAGGTSSSGATTIPSHQIITGPYATRISTLKTCLERIFSSGVTVTLIE